MVCKQKCHCNFLLTRMSSRRANWFKNQLEVALGGCEPSQTEFRKYFRCFLTFPTKCSPVSFTARIVVFFLWNKWNESKVTYFLLEKFNSQFIQVRNVTSQNSSIGQKNDMSVLRVLTRVLGNDSVTFQWKGTQYLQN